MDRKNTYTRKFLWNRLLIAAAALVLLFSCNKDEKRRGAGVEEFVKRDDCGLFGHGGFLFRYDEGNCQFSINPARRQARMQNDSQEDYVNMQFSTFPSPASAGVEVVLRYKVGNEEISSRCNMETIKYEGNKFWLWDGENSLGLITWCSTGGYE